MSIRNDTDNKIDDRMTTTRKQKLEKKQLCGRFKRLIKNISHQKTCHWLRKENRKRETVSLSIAAEDNRNNRKCMLYGDRVETINPIISECSKLALKDNMSRHVLVGKVIYWEMYEKFKFDQTNKWYMHNPAFHLENGTHKFLWDFDI